MKLFKNVTKKIVICVYFNFIIIFGFVNAGEQVELVPTKESPEITEVKKRVKLLESEGKSKEATEVYRRAFIRSGDLDYLLAWFDLDSERYQKCKPHNKMHQLTDYMPPSAYYDALKATVFDPNIFYRYIFNSPASLYTFEKKRKEIVEREQKKPLQFLDEKSAKKTIEEYEAVRESLILRRQAIQDSLIETKQPVLEKFIDFGKKHEAFAKNVAEARCKYISFDVLSPRFARCRQLVFLSDHRNILGRSYSMEELNEAAKILGSDRELVLESNQEVRLQFLSLLKEIRGLAGKAAIEELEVIGGLLGGKDLGADRWLK